MSTPYPLITTQNGSALIAQAVDTTKKHILLPLRAALRGLSLEELIANGAAAALEIDAHRKVFQAACNIITERDLGFTAFDEMDAYELENLPWVDVEPDAFVREHFAEDYDRLRAEQAERDESDAPGEEDDDGQG